MKAIGGAFFRRKAKEGSFPEDAELSFQPQRFREKERDINEL